MGVLKSLTDEYFGYKIRKEDSSIKELFEKSLNRRDFFVSFLKKKGWGEDSKDFLIFNDGTTIDDVIILNEMDAKNFLSKVFGVYYVVSLKTFLTTEETYFENFTLPQHQKEMEDKIRKICKLYYDFPQVVTYYLLMVLNDYDICNYNDNLMPFKLDTHPSDETFEGDDEYEDGDNILIFSTTDGVFYEFDCNRSFSDSFDTIIDEFNKEMKKHGFKLTDGCYGYYPNPTVNYCYFYR